MHLSIVKLAMNSIFDPRFSFWNFQFEILGVWILEGVRPPDGV